MKASKCLWWIAVKTANTRNGFSFQLSGIDWIPYRVSLCPLPPMFNRSRKPQQPSGAASTQPEMTYYLFARVHTRDQQVIGIDSAQLDGGNIRKKINNDSSSSYIEQHTVIKTKLPNWSEWGSSKKKQKKSIDDKIEIETILRNFMTYFFLYLRDFPYSTLLTLFFFSCVICAPSCNVLCITLVLRSPPFTSPPSRLSSSLPSSNMNL